MKELKATEGFGVALERDDERMFLVSVMLSGDTVQLVCHSGGTGARVCP